MSFLLSFTEIESVLEIGIITSVTVLALFLSYTMLNVCDLSTDGCFTLGASVGAMVAICGHPYLSVPVAMLIGMGSGLVTAFLQTFMGIDSLLSGIIVNTALYSVNMAVMGKKPNLSLYGDETVFTKMKALLAGTFLAPYYTLVVLLLFVAVVIIFLSLFLKTRLGLAIRATGNNPAMVRSSSINPYFTTIIGLCVSGSLTALSGCLMAQTDKSMDINIGTGMVTISLASLLIGRSLIKKRNIPLRMICAVVGAIIFRLVTQIAIKLHLPAYMLRLVSSVIVAIAIAGPYIKSRIPMIKRRISTGRRN